MDPRLVALAANRHGLIVRSEALAAGLPAYVVDALIKSGDLQVVRRSIYAPADQWAALAGVDAPRRLRAIAASLAMRSQHVLSHDSASYLLGLPVAATRHELIHVTRPRVTGTRTEWGVKHHGAKFEESRVIVVAGVAVLDRARTAVDMAREHGVWAGLVAADAALRAGVSRAQLLEAAEPMAHWRGKPDVDTCIELANAGAESPGESLLRLMVIEAGIGIPETQFELRDNLRHARGDIRVGRHVFEFDGEKKYKVVAPGRDPRATAWDEKLRQDWFHRYRLGMSRVVWADCFGQRRTQTIARLRREYADTCQRYGTDISDLASLIVRRAS